MSDQRKTRGDAVLKTLPEERQRDIYQRLLEETLAEVQGWLKEDGIKISQHGLSEFHSWYALRRTLRQTESDAANFIELVKTELPELPAGKVDLIGEMFFNLTAIKQQDPKLFLALQKAKHRAEMDKLKYEQRERELKLEREKLELQVKSDIDKALDALFGEIAKDPEAVELFKRFKARVDQVTKQ